eukprot:GFUD01038500.1.p1 GENE.GFUD01038500.1~~GFUD01038500.1.p1  ORF type:complete len:467 (+),score=85.85 GFUD01038500.1:46-1401(+)
MNISLQNRSSWLDNVSYPDFPTTSGDQVKLLSGDGQTLSFPVSLLVSSSSFLQSLLPPSCSSCACATCPTISLPSTTGLTLTMLAQVLSFGETEQPAGESLNNCLQSVQEVLERVKSNVSLVVMLGSNRGMDLDHSENLKVVKVESLADAVVKEEFEVCHNWNDDDAPTVQEESFADIPPDHQDVDGNASVDVDEAGCWKCPVCDRIFLKLSSLTTHKESHRNKKTELKKYQCVKCGLNYSSKWTLERHVTKKHGNRSNSQADDQISETIQKFQCSTCDTSFYTSIGIVKHRSEEHGDNERKRDFKCSKCIMCYYTNKELQRHKRYKHGKYEQKTILRCPICGLSFSVHSQVLRHINMKHPEGKDQEQSESLKDKKGKVRCSLCQETFFLRTTLKRHMKRVHEGVIFGCGVCNKIYSQKSHLYCHCKKFDHDKGLMYEIMNRPEDDAGRKF